MRPLVIDADAKATAARVLAYAEQHHYYPGQPTPGDNPNFVAKLDTYRVVFTYTHADEMVWRHLSVSIPSDKMPSPAAVFMIAALFGFTGWDERTIDRAPDGWLLDVSTTEHCVVVAQPVRSEVKVSH